MTLSRLSAAALAVSLFATGAVAAQIAGADEVRQACAADFQKACPDAKPGNGGLKACAKAHFMSFSSPCKQALKALRSKLQQSGEAATTGGQ